MIVITIIKDGQVLSSNVPLGGRASLEVQHDLAVNIYPEAHSIRVIEGAIPDPPRKPRFHEDDDDR